MVLPKLIKVNNLNLPPLLCVPWSSQNTNPEQIMFIALIFFNGEYKKSYSGLSKSSATIVKEQRGK